MLKRLKSWLPKSSFWRNLALVAGGTAAGQALTILASPVLSRLYSAEDFGLMSVYGSMTAMIAVVATLGYHQAIPAPEDDRDGANLTLLSLLIVSVISLLSALALTLGKPQLERYFGLAGFSRYLLAVPVGVLGLSAYEVLSQWIARRKAFGLLAKTSVQRGGMQTGAQLIGGFAHVGALGLVVGQLLGQWGGTLQLATRAWRNDPERFRAVTSRSLVDTAWRFRRFPFFTLPGTVFNAVDANVAPLLFAHFFGAAVTGYFALGNRLVAVPFMLIANSAQRVFYPAAATAKQSGTLAKETGDTYLNLLRVVLPIVLVMTACAPELFIVLMGAEWREAGVYMQWLSLRACFTIVVFPLTPLIFVLDRQGMGTVFSGIQLLVRVSAIVIGSHYDARVAVGLLGVGTGLLWLGYLFYLLAISGVRVLKALGQLLVETLIGVCIAGPILVVKLLGVGPVGVTAMAVACGLVAAVTVVRRSGFRIGARSAPT